MDNKNPKYNISKRIVSPTLRYLDTEYGSEVTERVLSELGCSRLYFDDVNGYMPMDMVDDLFRISGEVTGDADFAYTVGRNLVKSANKAQLFFMTAFATPAMLFRNMDKIENRLVKTTRVGVEPLERNKFRLTIFLVEGYRESYFSCRNRIGTYESLPTLFGLPCAEVKHTQCVFRGDSQCVYEVTLPEMPYLSYRYHFLFIILVSMCLAFSSIVLKNIILMHMGFIFLGTGLLGLIFILRKQISCMKNWNRQSELALEAQFYNLMKQNDLIKRLQDFSVDLNSDSEVESVSRKASENLERLFGYTGGMVWVVNERQVMYCRGSYGFSSEIEQLLNSTRYFVSAGKEKPDTFIAKVFGLRETLLINDPQKATEGFISITRYLVNRLNPSSLIISPLTEGEKVIGMIVGVNLHGEIVQYEDKLVFESVASIVSNAVSKVQEIEKMKQMVKERKLQIQQRNKELTYARKMVIQSEQQFALGRIVSSIIEELRNPVRFLSSSFAQIRFGIKKVSEDILNGNFVANDMNEFEDSFSEANETINAAEEKLGTIRQKLNSLVLLTDKEQIKTEGWCLECIVETVEEIISPQISTDVELCIRVQNHLKVHIDSFDLMQILFCLINNSLDSIKNSSGKIEIEAFRENHEVVIHVNDTGRGISPEIRNELMKPFFTTKNRSFHYGLGLTLIRDVVSRNKGRIDFSSEYGKGTRFSVFLPDLKEK